MGTVEPDNNEKVHGVIRVGQQTIEVVTDTAFGQRRGGSVYALLLLLIVGLVLAGSSAPVAGMAVGITALVLLGIWVGGRGK